MRKIIGVVIASMMFANIGFAEITLIEDRIVEGKHASGFHVAIICVDGYKFVVTVGDKARSMVQFMRHSEYDGQPIPKTC